jgi:hypothetical protein
MQSVLTLIKAIVERKTATQLFLLKGYQRVNPIPKKKEMMHFDK